MTSETKSSEQDGRAHAENPAQGDTEILLACEAEDYGAAVTALLRVHGDDLMSFLVFQLRNRTAADEVFALLAEELWKSLPQFQWRSSVRTWSHAIARHVAARYARAPHRKPERNLDFDEHSPLSQVVQDVRTRTQRYLQTEAKSKMRALREQLPEEDQLLLVLRVNRQLSWRDAALVMSGDPERTADEQLDRESARLRKRFERIKAELRRLAERDGLL